MFEVDTLPWRTGIDARTTAAAAGHASAAVRLEARWAAFATLTTTVPCVCGWQRSARGQLAMTLAIRGESHHGSTCRQKSAPRPKDNLSSSLACLVKASASRFWLVVISHNSLRHLQMLNKALLRVPWFLRPLGMRGSASHPSRCPPSTSVASDLPPTSSSPPVAPTH